MDFQKVKTGVNPPDDINVIIEIPAYSQPVKYEVDKECGALRVDRFISTAMFYPANYGYIPHTLGLDGDPADALVITPVPLISGSIIKARPIGVLHMVDESGEDAKILAVPVDKLTPEYRQIKSPQDVSPQLLLTIEHFFQHYKDLEKGKWVKISGWGDAAAAKAEIKASIARAL